MNPLLVLLIDGSAYFIGLALVAAGIVAQGLASERRAGRWLGRLVLVGVAVAAGSAPAQPLWLMVAWAIAALGGGLALGRVKTRGGHGAIVAGVLLFSLAMAAAEMRYRATPALGLAPSDSVCVIGDSFSAGLGTNEKTWPAFLADMAGCRIVNLATAGATLDLARAQADSVPADATCVLLEIGGNDMLGRLSPKAFGQSLERLVAQVATPGRRVAMFELPLPPLKGEYGRAQRAVAARYGVALIPKRILTAVLTMPGGTTDGLHLSPAGHEALARSLLETVR